MSSSEDFKQAIRAGNISEAFLVAMSNAPELNITTKIITAEGERVDAKSSEVDNYLRTHINLIEGKVENEIGEKLTGDRYSEIKQFHIEQVTQGHQTIQHNLISLQKMFQLMSSFQQQQTSERANWVDIAADVTRESLPSNFPERLYSDRVTNALGAGTIPDKTEANTTEKETVADTKVNDAEPQLPSFEAEDDDIVDDLLSLTDIDDSTAETRADWSEWLEDEPDIKAEVFDLQSLDVREAAKTWQNWEAENEAVDIESEENS